MRLELISFTDRGAVLGTRLAAALRNARHTDIREAGESLPDWTAAHFQRADGLIFIGAAGIAVRAIALHIRSKAEDPAVVVVDELGLHSIALLSGHLGGANELARQIAALTGGEAVITTATDLNGVFGVDSWARAQSLTAANPECIKAVSSRLLRGETIAVYSEVAIAGAFPRNVGVCGTVAEADVAVTWKREAGDALHLVPPAVTAGIGCRKGVPAEAIGAVYSGVLAAAGIHSAAVRRVCTIDRKGEEPGLVDFCRAWGLELTVFSPEQLRGVEGTFTASDFVRRQMGVDNVCERGAVLGSGGGRLLVSKQAENGVTVALALEDMALRFEEES